MSLINLSQPDRTIRIGVILMNGETELLDVAPIDLLHGMSKCFADDMPDFFMSSEVRDQCLDAEYIWVSETGSSGQNSLTTSMKITPTHSFDTCPPLDIVIIGAHKVGYHPNDAELAFVRKSYESCAAFITICGGMDVALRAGLLHGKTATCPRPMLNILRTQAPDTNWVERRWERDGKLWTSGALLNGLDLISAFAKETWGASRKELMNFSFETAGWVLRDQDYKDEFQLVV